MRQEASRLQISHLKVLPQKKSSHLEDSCRTAKVQNFIKKINFQKISVKKSQNLKELWYFCAEIKTIMEEKNSGSFDILSDKVSMG